MGRSDKKRSKRVAEDSEIAWGGNFHPFVHHFNSYTRRYTEGLPGVINTEFDLIQAIRT